MRCRSFVMPTAETSPKRSRAGQTRWGAASRVLLMTAVWLSCYSIARADILHGIGVMGDSASIDSASYKWPVQLQTNRGLNFGGSGLPYDYAVGGATSSSLLTGKQHTKLAADVTAGKVTLGILFIGNNDWLSSTTGQAILLGTVTPSAQTAFETSVVNNIKTAANTQFAAGIQGLLLGSVEDLTLTAAAQSYLDPNDPETVAAAARMKASVSNVNAQLLAYAQEKHIPFVDFYALGDAITSTGLKVGGVNINMTTSGSDPRNFWIDDIHPGIVGNAILGNMWMEAINIAYGTKLSLYTDQQILTMAKLGGSYTGETFSTAYDLSDFIHFNAVPEPSTLALGGVGALLLVASRWRRSRVRPARE